MVWDGGCGLVALGGACDRRGVGPPMGRGLWRWVGSARAFGAGPGRERPEMGMQGSKVGRCGLEGFMGHRQAGRGDAGGQPVPPIFFCCSQVLIGNALAQLGGSKKNFSFCRYLNMSQCPLTMREKQVRRGRGQGKRAGRGANNSWATPEVLRGSS